MATGLGPLGANTALAALVAAYPWVQLHTADPGAAGTTAVATETTRKTVTWGTPGSGSVANTVAVTWTNIAGSQDATHFTSWSASSASNFGFSGTITANAYTAGDTYTVGIGALTTSFTLAS